jgi:hypothetical protein
MLGVAPLGVNSDTKRGRARETPRRFSKLFANNGGTTLAKHKSTTTEHTVNDERSRPTRFRAAPPSSSVSSVLALFDR